MNDLISRKTAIDLLKKWSDGYSYIEVETKSAIKAFEEIQPKDYTDLKQEFLRMASYIDILLECSDIQKKTLNGFISRLWEFMPWVERD